MFTIPPFATPDEHGIAHGPCLPNTYDLNSMPEDEPEYVGPYISIFGKRKSGITPPLWH